MPMHPGGCVDGGFDALKLMHKEILDKRRETRNRK
jgi:hypothetical protein